MKVESSKILAEEFVEGKGAYNTVLGAMVGVYLGLTTTAKTEMTSAEYLILGCLLVCLSMFVTFLNNSANRAHRHMWIHAGLYLLLSLFFALSGIWAAGEIDLEKGFFITIIVVWYVLIGAEMGIARSHSYARRKVK